MIKTMGSGGHFIG